MLATQETFYSQRHLALPDNIWQAGGPPGLDIELLNGGFIIWAGKAEPEELARMRETLGVQYGLSPVCLEIDADALQNWGEQLIKDAMRDLSTRLVQQLRLYSDEEGFLAGSRISHKISIGMTSVLPVLDEDYQAVTLLEAFENNEPACRAALFAGLYFSVMDHLEKGSKQNEFAQQVFDRHYQALKITDEDYEAAIQIANRSLLLHECLYPYGATSLHQSIEGVLDNGHQRRQLLPLLERAAFGLTNQDFFTQITQAGVLPVGQLSLVATDLAVPTDAEWEEAYQRITTDPIAGLEFVRYLMQAESDFDLREYIAWRLNQPKPTMPTELIELDDEAEISDANQ